MAVKATATLRTPAGDNAARANAQAALADNTMEAELLGNPPETVTTNAEVVGEDESVPQTSSALTVRGTTTLVKGAYYDLSDGGLEGDFDQSDVRHPLFRIVNGSGPLSQKHSQGTILLGDEELLPAPNLDPAKAHLNPVLRIVPLKVRKQFTQKLSQEDYDAGIMPETVNSLAEVEARGGTTQWINGVEPSWQSVGVCSMLIERPADGQPGSDHPLFSLELDGKVYAPATYYAKGGAYSFVIAINSNKPSMFVGEVPHRKLLIAKHVWTFRAVKRSSSKSKFSSFAPEARLLKHDQTGPELRAFVAETLAAFDSTIAAE